MDTYLYTFYAYLPFAITGLILFILVIVLRLADRKYLKIRYISASSIISFALVLMLILITSYASYASKDWLYYLFFAIWTVVGYPPFLVTIAIVSLFKAQDRGVNFEDPIWQCIVFVVSFVFNTLLIFLMIRISLYLKNKFWSGKALQRTSGNINGIRPG